MKPGSPFEVDLTVPQAYNPFLRQLFNSEQLVKKLSTKTIEPGLNFCANVMTTLSPSVDSHSAALTGVHNECQNKASNCIRQTPNFIAAFYWLHRHVLLQHAPPFEFNHRFVNSNER
ncbi:hypothetical protein Bhyg_02847 [Pseudolycoriella hygida]|uniref:Uncharacterized protein n=1 Tax=Pseudolycoriella hygida TaxID=35572 RepID=A0A9Q0NCA8_9DIPT|nr:hypothetical protein Bhyg_02847 [Pseudolycoriella hygida]